MRILMTGATGFLGKAIARELLFRGHDLVLVSRSASKARDSVPCPVDTVAWDPAGDESLPIQALEGVEAIVHLAGEPIAARRWSSEQKRRVRDSRVLGTRHLWQGIAHGRARGKTSALRAFVAASAIGYFGDRGDTWLSETSSPGEGFLAEVCQAWEKEIFPLGFDEIRKVAVRVGIVLGREGGALTKLLPVFRKGAGGPLGSGKQWMSWIHLQDAVAVFVAAIESDLYRGPVHAVAPHPVTNGEFAQELGRALRRPALVPAPAPVLKLALGEMSSMVLEGQKVRSDVLARQQFAFAFPRIEDAFADLCLPPGEPNDAEFVAEQWIPRPVDEIFPFFSDAKNLEAITPPWLNFNIESMSTPKVQSGTLIDYRLRLHGIPFRWRTRIEGWVPNTQFVDTQLNGPYAKWHHTHSFFPMRGGTLMRDRVLYRLPLGALGKKVAHWKIEGDIRRIFEYRRERLTELFARRKDR